MRILKGDEKSSEQKTTNLTNKKYKNENN